MKNKYRNWFMLFGVLAIVIMLLTMDMDYSDIWRSLLRAGIWFPAVLVLWFFVYLLNTCSWYLIINDEKKSSISFWRVYKLSVSGFALNYTTPCGLMGGEPYRIMELTPYVGVSKASSSVILYVMMHIFSHIWLWFLSVFLYIFMYPVSLSMGLMLAVVGGCCLLAIYFFSRGYRTGMALKTLVLLTKIPFLRKWASGFLNAKRGTLEQIDEQIALLHRQHKKTFYSSLGLEFSARVLSSLEIYFILHAFSAEVSFADCVLILAFSSLFSNLIFFSPMQLGAREGGLALAVDGLHLSGALGVYTGLITRIRELFWIAVGILLIKIGNNKKQS
ncbi:lysylphosphatidylglycerol synthase transmembrane domain-containing protein [Bacteroides sp. GD17]|jgi:uncharacterized membrane protein YbhN (UPF0104 family)|uniref:lysylphosphatidylglycerol synthase transmembrane domain-containing protein n=1 Tax=Bacteroides sp. GD17 TaxID=3139826 RepID=UPI0025D2E2DD|nr:lysylphosphatidylglycerol synthase transmembrane domain-containing protein [uncultured Bacteroides sp.]